MDGIGRIWTVRCGETSRQEVEMLSIRVYRQGNKLHAEPRVKNMGPPLSQTSCHPFSVHRHWPIHQMMVQKNLCTNLEAFMKASQNFIDRFQMYHAPPPLIHRLQEIRLGKTCNQKSAKPLSQKDCLWLTLEYHPLLAKSTLHKTISAFLTSPDMRYLYQAAHEGHLPPMVQISWSSSNFRAQNFIQKSVPRHDPHLPVRAHFSCETVGAGRLKLP